MFKNRSVIVIVSLVLGYVSVKTTAEFIGRKTTTTTRLINWFSRHWTGLVLAVEIIVACVLTCICSSRTFEWPLWLT